MSFEILASKCNNTKALTLKPLTLKVFTSTLKVLTLTFEGVNFKASKIKDCIIDLEVFYE